MIEPYVRARSDGSAPVEPSYAAIEERAYFLWIERGREHHGADGDWLRAEREIRYITS